MATSPPTRDDVVTLFETARDLPCGSEQIARVNEAVAAADATGDEHLQVTTRMGLVRAHLYGGHEWQVLEPFMWLMARRAERPDLFTHEQGLELLSHFSLAAAIASRNPDVGYSQVRLIQQAMDALVADLGVGEHGLHEQRAIVAMYLGRYDESAAAFEQWRRTERSPSDCVGCDACRAVTAATLDEDWERAVQHALPAAEGLYPECSELPLNAQDAILIPLLLSGRPQRAWQYYIQAYAAHRAHSVEWGWLRDHLGFLALSGRVDHGLRVLRDHADALSLTASATELQEVLTGLSLVLREAVRAGRGEEPLGVEIAPNPDLSVRMNLHADHTLAEACSAVTQWLRRVGESFDARNGNTGYSERIERYLALEPVLPYVPDSEVTLVDGLEPLPDPLPPTLLDEVRCQASPEPGAVGPTCVLDASGPGGVELGRRVRLLNAAIASGDAASTARAAHDVVRDLQLCGRDLEVMGVVALGKAFARRAGEQDVLRDLIRLEVRSMQALGLHKARLQAALELAGAAREAGDPPGERAATELAADAALCLRHYQWASSLLVQAGDVELTDDAASDLLGRQRYLRLAARALMGTGARELRASRLKDSTALLDRARAVLRQCEPVVGPAGTQAEREGLARDEAWVQDRAAGCRPCL